MKGCELDETAMNDTIQSHIWLVSIWQPNFRGCDLTIVNSADVNN